MWTQSISPYGNFPIKSYRSADFNAPSQIHATTQNDVGEVFFANNSGILTFNGESWNKIKIGNDDSRIKSLDSDENGRVYFGGESHFGYLDKGIKKKFNPVVLFRKDSTINDQNGKEFKFKDINFVIEIEGTVFYIGEDFYFRYDVSSQELNLNTFGKDVLVEKAYSTYNKVIIYSKLKSETEITTAIFTLDKDGLKSTPNKRTVARDTYDIGNDLVGVYQIKNKYFFFQRNSKVYATKDIYNVELDPLPGFNRSVKDVVENIAHYDGAFLFGTRFSGVVCYDEDGKFIRALGRDNGLTDLNIENSFVDRDGNLWLNYDKGIDILELNAPIRFYNYKTKFFEYVEKVVAIDSSYYIGTRQNLFRINKTGKFIPYEISKSLPEIYDIVEINGDKLVIAFDGILKLNANMTDSLVNSLYAWTFEVSDSDPNKLYVGLDGKGVAVMQKTNGKWQEELLYPETTGEVRSICSYQGNLYFSQQGTGIIAFNEKSKALQELLPDFKVEGGDGFVIEDYDNDVLVGSRKGLFKVTGDHLERFNILEGFVDSTTYIHRLYNDGKGKLWTVVFKNYKEPNEYREIGYIEKVDGKYKYVIDPFKDLERTTVQSLVRSGNDVWFSGSEGLFYHNLSAELSYKKSFEVLLDELVWAGDTINAYSKEIHGMTIEIPYDGNIRFKINAPQYFGGVQNQYRFFLEGKDNEWSEWSTSRSEVLSRLPHGNYTLKFQARNYYGNESDIKSINFVVLPPWYFTWWAYVLYAIAAILIVVLVARLSVNRVKKQKEHLEEVVQERTSEIAEQNKQLEHQKSEIEEKTNDILDSIKYAERIQQTILPADEHLEELFDDHFVLFRPKDIVSGDFYWAELSNKMFLFSAIDCTGHGVPGAFVSIVGHNGLTRAVNEFGHYKPADILNSLREIVIDAFKGQGKADVKDGMDIALCGIDYDNMILHFSGAHNPCVIIRNGELFEIKADKQPIGQFEYAKPFTAHEFKLEKGDCVYVYSDGYVDQFGGAKGKKFKSKPFKQMLCEIHDKPMKEQLDYLNKKFDDWRGEFEQIDDVCVFGVRV